MKPEFEKYRYRDQPGKPKTVNVRVSAPFRAEAQRLAELEKDSFAGLCIEGIGRVWEDRLQYTPYRQAILDRGNLSKPRSYIRSEVAAYEERFRGRATVGTFRAPQVLAAQLEVMTHLERCSAARVCHEGLVLVMENRRLYPVEAPAAETEIITAGLVAEDELEMAYMIAERLLPPEG